MGDQLPIDIQVDKFLDWLVSRQKVPAQWSTALRDVRSQLTAAVSALPLAVKSRLTEGMDITDPNALHYFHCLDMLKLIEQNAAEAAKAGGDSKQQSSSWSSWLGGGSKDATTKQWDGIIKAYQKQNLYLADGARILQQNVNYEIPALRKLIAASAKQTGGLERKIADSEKSAKEFQNKYADTCRQLHIPFNPTANVRAELIKTASELDPMLTAVVDAAKSHALSEAIEYYREFTSQQLQMVFDDHKHSEAVTGALLPSLTSIRSGATPSGAAGDKKTAAAAAPAATTAAAAASAEDDFGITLEDSGDADAGIKVESSGDSAAAASSGGDAKTMGGGIDWGALGGSAPSDADAAPGGAAIDWGDSKSDAKTSKPDGKGDAKSAASSTGPKGLDDADTRHAFITDLLELECFLTARVAELQAGANESVVVAASTSSKKGGASSASAAASSSSSSSAAASGSSLVSTQSIEGVSSWLSAVSRLLTDVRNPRVQQLSMIRTSARYVDRLVASVKQRLVSAERLQQNALTAEERLSALHQTLATSEVKLRALAMQTLALKALLEGALSKQYDGRRVNLFGGDLSSLPALTGASTTAAAKN